MFFFRTEDLPQRKKYTAKGWNVKNNNIYNLGEIPHGDWFYKYMNLEVALLGLEKGKLRFSEPTAWDDEYEGRFYNADYHNVDPSGDKSPFLYACCMTTKAENEAAWQVYQHNGKGLASHCVEFKLNRKILREEIMNHYVDGEVYVGAVRYMGKGIIDHIHEPILGVEKRKNDYYDAFFNDFSKDNYLSLLLLKRSAYEHEVEVRFFVVPFSTKQDKYKGKKVDPQGKPQYLDVKIDWVRVVDKICVDNDCSDYEIKLLQNKIYSLLRKKKKSMKPDEYQKKRDRLKVARMNVYEDDREGQITILPRP